MKKRSSKKIIVAILLVTMLSQTLYSAAAGVFGLRTQSYAYADDGEVSEAEPGEDVKARETGEDTSGEQEENAEEESYTNEEANSGDSVTESETESTDKETVEEETEVFDNGAENSIDVETREAYDIRLRVSYVDSETGSA
ncbi:MAG: hypothetical protein IJV16_09855, partial [Lachnospiraceae bacterium]|nr:hypothetical protein [Lachnospiraceae bacterium]